MPIDTSRFAPDGDKVVPWRIGFSGRIDDPRKNIELLLAATARLSAAGHPVTLELIGGEPSNTARAMVAEAGLDSRVRFIPYLPAAELAVALRALDVYVVPSHQEGLCIAALEAMASGCPVVSTRCGGPEDYVSDGLNGALVGFDAGEMADAIARCAIDRSARERLSAGARSTVETRFERAAASTVFWQNFEQVFGAALREAA